MTDKKLLAEWQEMAKKAAASMNLQDVDLPDMILASGTVSPSDIIISEETLNFLERLRRGEHLNDQFLSNIGDGPGLDL